MPNSTIEPATRQHKTTVANLTQLYLHDLNEYDTHAPGPDGLFTLNPYFDAYWEEATRHPYLIWVHDKPAGFAFVRELDVGVYSMAEFFILRGHRGTGLAAKAATHLFEQFRGEWRVAQMENNIPAQRFWRRVIREYTNGTFKEDRSDTHPRGPMQMFSNMSAN